MNMDMGLITPPVGLNVYMIKGIFPDIKIGNIFKGIIPFVVLDALAIAIIMLFPKIALWLPGMMG
jgi:TRAP-type C4-dicarboxylate transport system permease large subunit